MCWHPSYGRPRLFTFPRKGEIGDATHTHAFYSLNFQEYIGSLMTYPMGLKIHSTQSVPVFTEAQVRMRHVLYPNSRIKFMRWRHQV